MNSEEKTIAIRQAIAPIISEHFSFEKIETLTMFITDNAEEIFHALQSIFDPEKK